MNTPDTDELPEDLRSAIDQCKDHQRKRPGADEADLPVVVVELRGETGVFMPPSFEAQERLQKLDLIALGDKTQMVKALETHVAETIYWMRGQKGNGPKGALEYLRTVKKSHHTKFSIFVEFANEVQERLSGPTVIASSKKY